MNRNDIDNDAAQLAGYRSPSVLAVTSLVLGLASPLCMLGPLLLVLPLAGAGLALAALRRIATSGGALVGARAAIIGLVLSTICGVAVFAHARTTRHLRTVQAAEFGRDWIQLLLAGDTQPAYRLMTFGLYADTAASDEPPPPGGDPYQRFVNLPVVRALSAAGETADVLVEPTAGYAAYGDGEFIVQQQYVVTPRPSEAADDGPRPEPIVVLMTLRRSPPRPESSFTWYVAVAKTGDEP